MSLLNVFSIVTFIKDLLAILTPYLSPEMQRWGLNFFLFPWSNSPPVGQGLLIIEASRSHSDTSQSVGLFWTSDQPVAETSTRHTQTTLTRDSHQWPRRDSNPQSGQVSGLRPTPYVPLTLGSAAPWFWNAFLLNFNAIRGLFLYYLYLPPNKLSSVQAISWFVIFSSFWVGAMKCIVRMKRIFKWATETFDLGSSCFGGILSWDIRRRSAFRGR